MYPNLLYNRWFYVIGPTCGIVMMALGALIIFYFIYREIRSNILSPETQARIRAHFATRRQHCKDAKIKKLEKRLEEERKK